MLTNIRTKAFFKEKQAIPSLRNLSPRIQIIQRAQGFQGKLRDKVCLRPNVYSQHSVS